MVTATLQEAKAKLNRLVEMACAGETVVLMRGTQVVAMLQPISSDDLEVSSRLTDAQAERFWKELDKEKKQSFSSADKAIQALKRS